MAFDALRYGGVAQHAQSEDEWRGAVRVRDNHRSNEQARAAPGLWMSGSAGTPNCKGEQDTSAPSTCEAGHASVRRVCACRAPTSAPVETTAPVATTAPRPMELSVLEQQAFFCSHRVPFLACATEKKTPRRAKGKWGLRSTKGKWGAVSSARKKNLDATRGRLLGFWAEKAQNAGAQKRATP